MMILQNESLGGSINLGTLTDAQISFLDANEWHLAAWPGDEDRLCMVYPKLRQRSRWFSRRWDSISWDFVKPSADLRAGEWPG